MENPFRKRTPENIIQNPPPSDSETPKALLDNSDTDPIYVTHAEDPSLDEDEMIIHTFVEPTSIKKENE